MDIKTIEKVKIVDYLNNLKIDNIQFDINSSVVPSASYEELNKLRDFIREHPNTYDILSGIPKLPDRMNTTCGLPDIGPKKSGIT